MKLLAPILACLLASCSVFGPDEPSLPDIGTGQFALKASGVIDQLVTGTCLPINLIYNGEKRFAVRLVPTDSTELRLNYYGESEAAPGVGRFEYLNSRSGFRASLLLREGSFDFRKGSGFLDVSVSDGSDLRATFEASYEQQRTRLDLTGHMWCPASGAHPLGP